MMKTGKLAGGLLFVVFAVTNAFAQEPSARVSVFGSGSFLQGERFFVVDGDPFKSEFVDGAKFGFRGTVDVSNHWAVEGTYSFGRNNLRITELDEVPPEERGFGVQLHQVAGNVLFFFNNPEYRIRPFATVGVGLTRFSPTDDAKARAVLEFIDDPAAIEASNKFSFNFGGGVEARASQRVGVRFDFRDHVAAIPRFGLPETSSGPGGLFFPVDGAVHDIEVSVGVVFYFR